MRQTSFKIKVGAPAAMLLAAAVTTAASAANVVVSPQPCLAWAMSAGAPLAARSAGVFLAKKAANTIRAMDRIGCSLAAHAALLDTCIGCISSGTDRRPDHTSSSYQHAAP